MFDSLLVVELASVLAGPSVGQFFAELGARVIKIENPATGGDVTRGWYRSGEDRTRDASYFDACNFGKESVGLDIRSTSGRSALRQLVARADILLTSFGPGSAERLHLTPSVFAEWNPGLIHGAVSGYGPADARPGYDAVIQAESGFMDLNGDPAGPPVKMPVALVDILAAHHLKEAILVELVKRGSSSAGGRSATAGGGSLAAGAYLEVSLLDAALASLANQATGWLRTGIVPRRSGSNHPNIAPYGTLLQTADEGTILLAVGNDRQFKALCAVLGADSLATDPVLSDNAGRVASRDRLDADLQAAARAWASEDLMSALTRNRVPAGMVRSIPDALSDASADSLILAGPGGDRSPSRGLRQWLFDPKPASLSPPPGLGAHTKDVLSTLTDLAPDAIKALLPASTTPS